MKKTIIALGMAMATVVGAVAQDNAVKFTVQPVGGADLPQAQAQTIEGKLRTALTRSQAVTDDPLCVFAVKPEVNVTNQAETEGMMREVATVSAEMTLQAVNTIDGNVYHSVTVPLKGSAAGGKAAAFKVLANSVKATDPVYVRFVKTARQRIADHYAENCAAILAQAQLLVNMERYKEAASYLGGIPSGVPCFDEASELLQTIAPMLRQGPDTVVVEHVVEVPVEVEKVVEVPVEVEVEKIVEVPSKPDTVVVEKEVVKVVEKVVEKPVVVAAAPAKPKPAAPQPKITIEGTGINVKVASCTGDLSRQRIVVNLVVTQTETSNDRPYVYLNTMISDQGEELKNLELGGQYKMRSGNVSMPEGVPVKMEITVTGVKKQFDAISYLQFDIRAIQVKIRDLAVNWI